MVCLVPTGFFFSFVSSVYCFFFRQWASYQIYKTACCACAGNAGNVFSRHRLQRKPLVSDPGMHHGTCVTHVPWCLPGSLTRGDRENIPGITSACATIRLTYLARGPYCYHFSSNVWISRRPVNRESIRSSVLCRMQWIAYYNDTILWLTAIFINDFNSISIQKCLLPYI